MMKNSLWKAGAVKSFTALLLTAISLVLIFSIQSTYAQSASITFNDLTNPNRNLNGQYPTGVADWGSNKWYLSGPWGNFSTNSVSFLNESVISASFNFVNATVLTSMNVFNGGTGSSTVSLACAGNTTVSKTVAANQTISLVTNWKTPCTTITVGSSNGWWTNFDDFAYGAAAATATRTSTSVKTATPTFSPTPTRTLNSTSTSTPILTGTATLTPTRTPTNLPTATPSRTPTRIATSVPTATQVSGTGTTWNNHPVVVDSSGKLVSWLSSPYPYDQLVKLTWNYIQNTVPNTSAGIKHYLSYCCFYEPAGGNTQWYHNPAGLYAAFVDSLMSTYPYTGNTSLITTVQGMLDYQLAHGTTPSNWNWANIPFASAVNGDTNYHGDGTNERDGVNGIQPDKAAELGYAYIRFWELTGNTAYQNAAVNIANILASKVRTGDATHSPWPFRVNAQTGAILEEYTSNIVAQVKLFDELIRLNVGSVATYQSVRNQAWNWVLAYPMQNNQWSAYFEDIPRDPGLANKNQITPMETARYILSHNDPASVDPQWQTHIPALLTWVRSTFGKGPYYSAWAIDEQTSCCSTYGLGSHTARWASINALWYERTGDTSFKDAAARAFNFATYFSDNQGVVKATLDGGSDWYSDGYADYIKHFMSGIASVPEWSPAGENHILRSSSVVSAVTYGAQQVSYTTFDSASRDRLRLNFAPTQVTVDGAALPQRSDLNQAGWVYNAATSVLDVRHDTGTHIVVNSAGTANINLAGAPAAEITLEPTMTASATLTLTPEATLSPTLTETANVSPTASLTPAATTTVAPSASPTEEPSLIPSATIEPTMTPTSTPLPLPSPTPLPTSEPTTPPIDNQMPTVLPPPTDASTPTLEPTVTG